LTREVAVRAGGVGVFRGEGDVGMERPGRRGGPRAVAALAAATAAALLGVIPAGAEPDPAPARPDGVTPATPVPLRSETDPTPDPRTGTYTSQGVGRIGAPAWHAAGLTGTGVRVGVVDTNFVGYAAAQAAGELPPAARLKTQSFCSAALSRPFVSAAAAVDRQRGTDAAEVVADVAPGAAIDLICIDSGNVADAQAAVDYAVAQGIEILVSDVRFFDGWRGDGLGPAGTIDAVVANARSRGVLWIQAAGETGGLHYRAPFVDANDDGYHEWSGSDSYNDVVQVASGEPFSVFLQWDQWPTSAQDFEIRVYQYNAATGQAGALVGTSPARTTQAPRRRLDVVAPATGSYLIAIRNTGSGLEGTTLDVQVARLVGATTQALTYGSFVSSVVDPGNSPNALTVVGWCYEPPDLFPEDASGPALGGARKPDLAAPSWVSTSQLSSTECQSGFGGTGAAAAHVAGAAALLSQRTPSLTVDQLRQAVLDRTVDVHTGGPDNDTGRGALSLGPPSNGAPNAGPVSATAKAGVATPITLAGTDPDGDALTYTILSNPTHGTLTGAGPAVTYTPDPRYQGGDSFTYRVTDPFAQASGVGTATIDVQGAGYYIVLADGTPQAHGNVPDLPAASGAVQPGEVAVGVAPRPQGDGYWIALRTGKVIAVGAAQHFGDASAVPLNRGVVGISSTASGQGYWLVAGDGGIFSFGDAQFFGSMGSTRLNQPVVGMSPTPTSLGYWLVATDGGIFSFGDARFQGSTGALTLNQPVFSMSPTRDGAGYWLVARDGGIFAFGSAVFHGSTGAEVNTSDVVSLGTSASGSGYYLVRRNGQLYAFGDAPDFGGLSGGFGTVIGLVVA
jgi:hypothetical protein